METVLAMDAAGYGFVHKHQSLIAKRKSESVRQSFAKRFNEALDDMNVSRIGRGRVNEVKNLFHLSQRGASKWVGGESMPDAQKMPWIAEILGVNSEWLQSGKGQKRATESGLAPAQLVKTNMLSTYLFKKSISTVIQFNRAHDIGLSDDDLAEVASDLYISYLSHFSSNGQEVEENDDQTERTMLSLLDFRFR